MKTTKWALSAILSLLVVGCAAKPNLVGVWQASTSQASGGESLSATTTLKLNSDGTVVQTTHEALGPIAMTDTSSGTYAVSGSDLTITYTSRTVGLDPATQAAVMQRLRQLRPGVALNNPPSGPRSVPVKGKPEQYTWSLKDPDTLDLNTAPSSPGGVRLTELTRVPANSAAGQPTQ